MLWFCEEVQPGLWVGFTDSQAANLAFHVGDISGHVAARRLELDAYVSELTGSKSPVHLQYMNQIHGRDVVSIGTSLGSVSTPLSEPAADGMVSLSASLAVMVADCVPVVFAGSTAAGLAVMGVAHAGRPGLEKCVIAATVNELRASGAQSLQAWVGPSVCGRCYEVPEEMRATVSAAEAAAFSTTAWGTPALDLAAGVVAQLEALEVLVHNVGVCTFEHPEFYSHRRAVQNGETEGRFIGFVAVAS